MTLRWRRARPTSQDQAVKSQEGFTLIEMIVALTLMASVLLTLAFALFGAMNGLVASRQRSAFVEIVNGEMETLRALSYDKVGVASNNTSATYDPGPTYQGRDAVIVASGAPAAVTTVTTSPVKGIILPYKVRRWITWTDTFGGTARQFKRLNVEVEWTENRRATRKLMLTSVLYPGDGAGVDSSNRAPTAVMAAPDPANAPPGTLFSFSGTGSTDPDAGDSIATYSWNFGDGFTASGSTVTHAYATAGTYAVTLTVVDSRGKASAPVSRNVGVGSLTNVPPTASFTFGPASGTAPVTATFTSTSTDGEGPISTWEWNWGDGTTPGTTSQATHVFQSAGTFTVTLTVTDSGGLSSSATNTIQVNPLNCDVLTGKLMNTWGSNTAPNDIKVDNNNEPDSLRVDFTATTNAACTAVTAKMPYVDKRYGNQILSVALVTSQTSGTKTWTGRFDFANNDQLDLGIQQNATMTASAGSATDVLTYSYNVHR